MCCLKGGDAWKKDNAENRKKNTRRKQSTAKVVNVVIVGNLLKAVVVPAATAAIELTQWQWLLAGMVVGSVVNNLAEERKERQTYEKSYYEDA